MKKTIILLAVNLQSPTDSQVADVVTFAFSDNGEVTILYSSADVILANAAGGVMLLHNDI